MHFRLINGKMVEVETAANTAIVTEPAPENALDVPASVMTTGTTMFAIGGSLSEKIVHAFDPVIELVQAISYPICFITICGGFLLMSVGQRHRGLQLIKWSAIGYLGVQLAPAIMAILVEVGKAMRQ